VNVKNILTGCIQSTNAYKIAVVS